MAATLLIRTRAEWGAEAPDYRRYAPFSHPAETRYGWVLHWPGANQYIHDHNDCADRVLDIQLYHKYGKGWSDGAYSFVLCPHGMVYEMRGWEWNQFATSPETNNDWPHYTVCVLTDLTEDPTDVQFEVLQLLIQEGRTRGCGLAVKPHSSLQSTQCPGTALRSFAALVDGRQFKQPEPPAQPEDEDLNTYVMYRDARYHNVWLVGGGGAVHLSNVMYGHYTKAGIPLLVDTHDQTLKSVVHLSGVDFTDLVAV